MLGWEIEHNALHVRSHVLRVETELRAHLQHGRIFDQHIAIYPPQTFFFGVVKYSPHQLPTEPVTLEPRAYQDREFGGLLIELVLQAHEPEHLACVFVECDEGHFVPVVEMAELINFRGAELGNARKKPES